MFFLRYSILDLVLPAGHQLLMLSSFTFQVILSVDQFALQDIIGLLDFFQTKSKCLFVHSSNF